MFGASSELASVMEFGFYEYESILTARREIILLHSTRHITSLRELAATDAVFVTQHIRLTVSGVI